METILKSVMKQCRAAMLAHIPILYIKTDSFELIREIVSSDELVVRISSSAPMQFQHLENRPYNELEKILDHTEMVLSKPVNWIQKLDKWASWKVPHIVTIATGLFREQTASPDVYREYVDITKNLDKYVRDYYDSNCYNQRLLQSSVIILYSQNIMVPEKLLPYTEIIEVPYPEREEIRGLVQAVIAEHDEYADDEQIDWLCSELSGLRSTEIASAMRKILTREVPEPEIEIVDETFRIYDKENIREIIRWHKQQILQGTDVLKLITVDDKEEIGGMAQLVKWIQDIADKRLLDNAKKLSVEQGIQPPKGVLLCGIPGCGKSLAAKLAAKTLHLSLLQMDVGRLMAGIQGESEENMRKALALTEAMAPCVLWIDELEKGFSGVSGNNSDGATFKRMFGTLLGWMQDNTAPCFIFATANDISGLPKEFFRSGRFDEIFAVYLPTSLECAEVFMARTNVAVKRTKEIRERKGIEPLFDGELFTNREDSEECKKKKLQFYLEIVNEQLVKDGKPRIVISADIQKIVNTALLDLTDREDVSKMISKEEWKKALTDAIQKCTVYGDGEENIESVAVSYCRMLRKGMKATVDKEQVLFKSEDYHSENWNRKKNDKGDDANDNILSIKEDKEWGNCYSEYDKAVYILLSGKIEEVAMEVEENERKKLIRG